MVGLVVRVGVEHLLLPVAVVEEVLPTPPVTPLPAGPPALAGMAAVRGRVLPVWHAAALLDLEGDAAPPRCARLRVDGVPFGLLVDGVEGLHRPTGVEAPVATPRDAEDGCWWSAGTAALPVGPGGSSALVTVVDCAAVLRRAAAAPTAGGAP